MEKCSPGHVEIHVDGQDKWIEAYSFLRSMLHTRRGYRHQLLAQRPRCGVILAPDGLSADKIHHCPKSLANSTKGL